MKQLKPWFLFFAFLASATILLFFHPLMVFPHFFLIAYFFFDKKTPGRNITIAVLIFSILAYMLKGVFFVTEYERHSMGISRRMLSMFPNYFGGYANETFFRNCIGKYCWIPVIWLTVVGLYMKQRTWIKSLLFGCCTIGYLLFINTTYSDHDIPAFYIENLYLPLGIFLAVPFVLDVLPICTTGISVAILLILIASASIRIYTVGDKYSGRLDWERRFLAAHNNEKLMMATDLVPRDTVILAWATPYEFWLLSTAEQNRTASILVHDSVQTLSWAAENKTSFVTEWGVFKYSDMPAQYFRFTDTVSNYKLLK